MEDNVVTVDFSKSRNTSKIPEPKAEPQNPTLQKLRVFEEFLEAGIVTVAFDPRAPSVVVPPRFRKMSDLRLNFSYGFKIDDFCHDEVGISATLRFPEGYFACLVPWVSLFAMRSETLQKDSFWLACAPKEVQDEIKSLDLPISKPTKTRPQLSLVTEEEDEIA